MAYAHLETKLFTVRRYTIPVLPLGSPDLRVLHISDLHLVPSQHRKIEWIRSLAGLCPEVVVNTGDNIAHPDSVPLLLDALEPLLGSAQGAFVMGSNDYFAPHFKSPTRYLQKDARIEIDDPTALPTEELTAGLRNAGWLDLDNARGTLTVGDVVLDMVGVDDPHMERDAFPSPAPLPYNALRVGVTHAPYARVLDEMYVDGAELILAGHTHGGQLCVPGMGALVTNCDLDRRRAKGLHGWPGQRPSDSAREDSAWLHVSAGAGTSPYAPFRFACRPEATLLTLTEKHVARV